MERVGVRELRQNLSVYLRRVREGESLEVTERGRPVAVLAPLRDGAGALDRLVAAGLARAAEGRLDEVIPPRGEPDPELGRRLDEALEETRADSI
jgi:prevent-host-death family protein